ncbi:MAG TPA: hypothetical protein VGK16_03105 [Candidatus Limnocylindrales bacterium]|jgi:hypothetical protein
MKFRQHKRDAMSYNPNHPHPYQQTDDAGLGAISSGGAVRSRGGADLTGVVVANRYQRVAGCGVPGCGRPRDDELHAPED